MPVEAQTPFNEYTGNGVTTVFPYQFQVLDAGDLTVTVDGVEKSIGTDYSISGVGNISGGNVTFVVSPALGTDILLLREMELERDTDYQKNGDLREEVVDRDFDRLWLALQEIASRILNAMTVPRSESIGPIPEVADRANMALGFDSAGEPVAIPSDLPQLEDALERAETAADESEAAAQRAEDAANNRVPTTSPTGAALIPEGADAQRPATGSIPAGAFVLRGSTQSGSDYFGEYWDRVASAWRAIASRTWVTAKIQELIDAAVGFTILYPNGGSPEVTQKVFANSRYVMTNPFPGFHVICEPEIFIESPATDWFKPGWATNLSEGYGVSAGMYGANQIIVQTGTNGVAGAAGITGGTAQIAVQTSAYCRVKIRKIKGAV